ncbi:MAG: DUF5317 domain-containing protein [Caldilineaceae bacterium]
MLLLLAIAIGLFIGIARALISGRAFAVPEVRMIGLVFIGFLPQFFVFFWTVTRELVTDNRIAAIALVSSQLLLLVFALVNRKQPGFWLLGVGLALNLAVILANGGLMPITPETMAQLAPPGEPTDLLFPPGSRLGTTKDVVLKATDTRLWLLSDIFLFPKGIPLRFAFSLGDALIGVGVLIFLWEAGAKRGLELSSK